MSNFIRVELRTGRRGLKFRVADDYADAGWTYASADLAAIDADAEPLRFLAQVWTECNEAASDVLQAALENDSTVDVDGCSVSMQEAEAMARVLSNASQSQKRLEQAVETPSLGKRQLRL